MAQQPDAQQERTPSEAAATVGQPAPPEAQLQPRGGADLPDPSYAPSPAQTPPQNVPQQMPQAQPQQTPQAQPGQQQTQQESVYTADELLAAATAGQLDANYETVRGAMAMLGTNRMTRSELAEAVRRFREREVK